MGKFFIKIRQKAVTEPPATRQPHYQANGGRATLSSSAQELWKVQFEGLIEQGWMIAIPSRHCQVKRSENLLRSLARRHIKPTAKLSVEVQHLS